MAGLQTPVDEWLRNLTERMRNEIKNGAAPRAEKLTVREFLARFGHARRGQHVVGSIRKKLEDLGLRTLPDFEFEYIDNAIAIELDGDIHAMAEDSQLMDPAVRVGILAAAHNPPVWVAPNHRLVKATTLMRMEDYSQLPVMTSERDVKGIVSWRSVGTAYSNGYSPTEVQQCMEEAHEIDINMTLADATDMICAHDYVLVRAADRRITGIVTAADLANQFKQHAHPFLLIGEIEHRLRNLVRRKFTVDEFAEASDAPNPVSGPDDLTLGGYCRLLQAEKFWAKLGLHVDRGEFTKRIDEMRQIRNEVMHFSPDDHEPLDMEKLERLVRFLRDLPRSGAGAAS